MQGLPNIGDIIDGVYEIKRLLGKGGFGAVFLATHIPMQRDIALKLLIAHGPNPEEMVERFKREVMAIRVLSHPNTVRIFDFRDSRDSLYLYYTMEALKGETLKDLMRREGAQSPRRVKHILRQILKSLSEAHSYGIVHRDLKPANLMLVDMHGEQDFVKVLDFGIAKILEHEDDENEPLTSAGMLVGTLRYMSPEQIKGKTLGPFTDLYSLGLITLELLMGESVYAGTGRWELMQKQVSDEPVELFPELHDCALYDVLTRALCKRAEERYATAALMLRDLESIPDGSLSDQPLVTAPPANPHPGALPSHSSQRISASQASHASPPPAIEQAETEITDSQAVRAHLMDAPHPAIIPSAMPALAPAPLTAQPALDWPDESASFATPPSSRGKLALISLALLGVLGAGVAVVMATSKGPTEQEPTPPKLALNASEVAPKETTSQPPELTELDPPQEVTQQPEVATREITVSLSNEGLRASIYRGDEELPFASAPGAIRLRQDESYTIRVEASGFEASSHLINDRTPSALALTLTKKTRRAKPPSKDEPDTSPKEDSTWTVSIPKTDSSAGEKVTGWAEPTIPKVKKKKKKALPKVETF